MKTPKSFSPELISIHPFFTQPVLTLEADLTHMLDLAVDLVELHAAPRDPLLKLVKVSLDGILFCTAG